MNPDDEKASRSIYLGAFAALTFVIVVFLISIPSTKKKLSSSTNTSQGTYTPPELRPISSILSDGKIVKFRSLATGENYKVDINGIRLLQGNNINPLVEANNFLENRSDYFVSLSLISAASPHFQRNTSASNPSIFYITDDLEKFAVFKYKTPVKPDDLTQQQYNLLLNEGWYIIPLFLIPFPLKGGTTPYTKPYLVGLDLLYSASVATPVENDPFITQGEIIENHQELIFNTNPELAALIDSAFNYRNVFRFRRTFGNENAFMFENILNQGVTFEVTRHNLIRPQGGMSVSNVNENGEYRNSNLQVDFLENVQSVPLISREITLNNRIRSSFYIEDSEL